MFASFAFIDCISRSNFVMSAALLLLVVLVFSFWRSRSWQVSAAFSSMRPSRTGRDALGSLAILEEIFEALSESCSVFAIFEILLILSIFLMWFSKAKKAGPSPFVTSLISSERMWAAPPDTAM